MTRFPKFLWALGLPLLLAAPVQAATFVVTRFDDPAPMAAPNGCNTGGSCSLREAVLAANAFADLDTIQLGTGQYDLSIPEAGDPESGDLDIFSSVTLQGTGVADTVINGVQPSLDDRLITVSNTGIIFNLSGITLQNGITNGDGGGLWIDDSTVLGTLVDCRFTNNQANAASGGGVFSSGPLTVTRCQFDANKAGSGGGLTFNSGGGLTITDSTFSGNILTVVGSGGGLQFSAGGALQIRNSSFENNELQGGSGSSGGGISCSGPGPMILDQVTVSGNKLSSNGTGGGVNCGSATIFVSNSVIENNQLTQGGNGGGMLMSASNITLQNVSVTGNQVLVNGTGGGLQLSAGGMILDQLTLANNSVVGGVGGGAQISGSNVFLDNSTVSGNSTDSFGAGIFISAGNVQATNSTITQNKANQDGGGLYMTSGTTQLSNLTIVENDANADGASTGRGGGIFSSSPFTIRNSILAQNSDDGSGPDCFPTMVTSDGYNIIGDATGCTFVPPQGDPASTDLFGADPQLGPLADNGGPTQTRALLTGSPAIDGGNPAGCVDGTGAAITTDQRGQVRPSGPRCDIGAFELGSSDLAIVKTASASQVDVGEEFSYTLEVTNNGPGTNFDIAVDDALPAGLSLVSAASDTADCTVAGNTVTCILDQLDAGASFTVEIVVTGDQAGQVDNTATVSGSETDPDPSNDSSTVSVTIGTISPVINGGGCGLSGAPKRGGVAAYAAMLLILGGGLLARRRLGA